MTEQFLKRITLEEVSKFHFKVDPVDPDTLIKTKSVVDDVKNGGDKALLQYAIKFGDIKEGDNHIIKPTKLKESFDSLTLEDRECLERTAKRIHYFADRQKSSIKELSTQIDGGYAGHSVSPMESAGCYAPGGRYPLPSSVLMTVITARVAGVKNVWVASPRPSVVTLAAAYIAGADALLPLGGAQTIAAFAYGTETIPACDAVVGPGNKWVTAAKQLIAGKVAIDSLAGPSECLVIADKTAHPDLIAADLLAQAEHDDDARAILVALDECIIVEVEKEIEKQLQSVSTAPTMRNALKNSFSVIVNDLESAIAVSDQIAPEHLELHVQNAESLKTKLKHYGALFIGHISAEVLGDYGAGPNHVLPTRGAARSFGGLSVFTFLRIRTWLQFEGSHAPQALVQDAYRLAKIEGLEGHAKAAQKRLLNNVDRPIQTKIETIVRLGIPKGRMEGELFKLLSDAGLKVTISNRGYRPTISVSGVEVKLLKPRNIVEMLMLGSRDIGFTGADLVAEYNANLTLLLDTGLDKVRIVAAVPNNFLTPDGKLPDLDRPLHVATEYTNLSKEWLKQQGTNYKIVHSRGATEVFPPEDADFIIDNTATGSTLEANKLSIYSELMSSTTGFYANPKSLENPGKKQIIEHIVTVLKATLIARKHIFAEFHVSLDKLEQIIKVMPSMKTPTLTKLADGATYSVKICANVEPASLIREIIENGGTDIVIMKPMFIVPNGSN